MWITISIDDKEISVNKFLSKLPSSSWFMEFTEEIQKIENWDTINIKVSKESREHNEDNALLKQI